MIEYESIYSIKNHEKKEFKPMPITIDLGYDRIDAENALDAMRETYRAFFFSSKWNSRIQNKSSNGKQITNRRI